MADSHGIANELLGTNAKRLNFVARLKGLGRGLPLLLMAHTDVVPADRSQWSVDPFSGELRNGVIYGRGAQDDKSLLAAELAVMVEIRRRNIRLGRDIILLGEADEEAGSSGIQWMIQHAWPKIDGELALGEGGDILETKDGARFFEVQTTEKIPTRVILTARGTAGHGSLPRADNPVLRLSHALTKLAEAEEPVRLNATTRRYFRDLSRVPEYHWLQPLIARLENPATANAAGDQIRARDAGLGAMLRTTVSPTVLKAGLRINVIPNTAEAQVDVRRLPNETREEVLARFRQILDDSAIEVSLGGGQTTPAAEASPVMTAHYRAMERAILKIYPRDEVIPYMTRDATDGAFLRARGMPVYGVPLFHLEGNEGGAYGNDERISTKNLEDGVELLWQIVLEIAGRD